MLKKKQLPEKSESNNTSNKHRYEEFQNKPSVESKGGKLLKENKETEKVHLKLIHYFCRPIGRRKRRKKELE